MKNQDQWGIAMQGNAEVITNAFNDAINNLGDKLELSEHPVRYVEIGVGEGLTVLQICKILDKANLEFVVTAVDIKNAWSFNQEQYLSNIQNYADRVELDLSGSPEALKRFDTGEVFAVLIDGDHTLEAVVEDFREADRIVMKGGLIMFHDSGAESQGADAFERQPKGIQVREAIDELGLFDDLKLPDAPYKLIVDHPDTDKNNRGIFIMRKKL